ncbi:MAG: IPT/TIG domain-containing protein [Myxococcota bacterium]
MTARLAAVIAALVGGSAVAGTKVIQNDEFTGSGAIFTGLSFGEYQGAAVLFEPPASEYPLKIIAIDVMCAPYANQPGGAPGIYVLDVWDESNGSIPPPRPNDGGSTYFGRVNGQGVQFSSSTTMFNRFALPEPMIVASGKVFVKVSEQLQTSVDGTTIALDTSTRPKPNANWFFDGVGGFERMDLPDGGFSPARGNWLIRLVLEVPDQPITVTSITPASGLTTSATNVVISGTNFELGARAFVGSNELTITNLTAVTVGATVPAGLPAGRYDVRVQNSGGAAGTLPNGFAILEPDGGSGAGDGGGGSAAEALALTDITPKQTWAEDATSVFLTGAGFQIGAQVLIGGTRLEGAVVESSGVISAALTARLLTPGVYDVSVINLSGQKATLPQAFTVLVGSHAAPRGCSCTTGDPLALVAFGLLLLRRRSRTSR